MYVRVAVVCVCVKATDHCSESFSLRVLCLLEAINMVSLNV